MTTTELLAFILARIEDLNRPVRPDTSGWNIHEAVKAESRDKREDVARCCEVLAGKIRENKPWDPFPKLIKGHLINGGIGYRPIT